MALTPIQQVLPTILAEATPLAATHTVALAELAGTIAASDIIAAVDVPPTANSAMDGYALRAADAAANHCLPVTQTVFAGSVPTPLAAGSCARIYTGGTIPAGADTVVMQEAAARTGDTVRFAETVIANQHIRPPGQDIQLGQVLYQAGHRFRPADLAVLAAVGIASTLVKVPLRVAILSSGDELAAPGQPLQPGQIYNSNRSLLAALLTFFGCKVVDVGLVADTLEATVTALQQAAAEADIVLSSGGVSVGDADFLKQALARVGQVNVWKLAIKPGKPLVYGRIGNVPYFGLPGNPSSAFVTFLTVVLPYIDQILARQPSLQAEYARADFAWPRAGSRQEYLRARCYRNGCEQRVQCYENQSSGIVLSTAWANALAVIPIGASFEQDTVIEVLPLPW